MFGNLIKLIFIAALAYGAYWVATNVDFVSLISDTEGTIRKEKTIVRVNDGRKNAAEDTKKVLGL